MVTAGLGGMKPNSVMFALPPYRTITTANPTGDSVADLLSASNQNGGKGKVTAAAVVLEQDTDGCNDIAIDSLKVDFELSDVESDLKK